ncbi:MAG: efflux RND transporter periplasmic adaptor subunit, partial [Deltaproteobacteria bacterium]|nr:efflux RND transporter periplasmic adaptor subunit [Deltaproteobacteria bacterium]
MQITQTNLLVAAVALAACCGLAGCTGDSVEAVNARVLTAPITPRLSDLETIRVRNREVFEGIRATGIVEAFKEVAVSAEMTGKVKTIHCKIGDELKQDFTMAELGDEARRIALRKKEALLQKARARQSKTKRDKQKADVLFKDGILSDSTYAGTRFERQAAEADLALARAEVLAARKDLQDTKIAAPFDGKVALKDIEIGSLITPGQPLFTLVDISKIKTVVNLSEFDVTKIAAENQATVTIDSLPGKVFSGKVEAVGLIADETTRTFPVEITVLNPHESILPGMVARVRLPASSARKVIAVPRKAVQTIGMQQVVSLVSNGTVEQRRVTAGPVHEDSIIIEKGLSAGDEIVVFD